MCVREQYLKLKRFMKRKSSALSLLIDPIEGNAVVKYCHIFKKIEEK